MRGDKPGETPERSDLGYAEQQRKAMEARVRDARDVSPGVVDQFHDNAGREMTVKRFSSWDRNDHGVRDYQLQHEGQRVGHVSLTMERSREYLLRGEGSPDQYERVKINDIIIDPPYRGAGSSEHLLAQVENEAQKHHAKEIYGAVTDPEAAAFWKHMSKDGWQLGQREGYGNIVSKQMRN